MKRMQKIWEGAAKQVLPPTNEVGHYYWTDHNLRFIKISAEDIDRFKPLNYFYNLKVALWFNHLKTVQENRKRGAAKAAQTRKKKGCNKKGSSKVCTLISSKSRQQHNYSQYHFIAIQNFHDLKWALIWVFFPSRYCAATAKKEDPKDDKAETVEWIQCDTCDNWYHQVCALTPLDDDMFWHCTFCVAVNNM